MKQNKGIKLAYTAGVIDSDGCIAIKKVKNKFDLTILLNSPDGHIIDYLYGCWGGNIYKTKPYNIKKSGEEGNIVWRWELKGFKAMMLCKKMIPFLTYKKKQAELAVQFQTHKINGMETSKNGTKYRKKPLTEYEIEYREELYKKMRDLKKTFMKPRAAVETK